MERVYTKNLGDHIDKKVTIAGWVDVRRDHGKLIFIDLRDRAGIVQIVTSPKQEKAYGTLKKVGPEWVLEVSGVVKKRPDNMVNKDIPTGDLEFEAQDVMVLGKSHELPFEKDSALNLDTYLDHLPLTLRTLRGKAIFKVQAQIITAFRSFLLQEDFIEIQPPKIIGEDAEGGASVFEIEYFGKTAHLAQSPQFYKQIMVGVFERVFATGNVFRAEKHSTTRHLNEYTSLDLEFGFIEDHHDVMRLGDKLMAFIIKILQKNCAEEFTLLKAVFPSAPKEIPYLKLREAQKIIKEKFGEDCTKEPDLTPQHERWLSEYAQEKFKSDFLYVTHFPTEKRPMYIYEDEGDSGYTKSFDLLFRGLEVNTGGQRVHDYDTLIAQMKKKGLDPEKFSFYLEAFKYGMPPHGGFGMGLERLTARFLGLENVKEATLFPREINRIDTLLSKN